MAAEIPILQNVLITGGTGFVGSATARALAEKHPECTITILDLNPPAQHALPNGISFIRVDITSTKEVYEAVEKVRPDVLIHTAGLVPGLSERFGRRLERLVWKINVEGTKNMLEAAKQAGVEGFIYTSTCCVITDNMDTPLPNIDERWPTPRSSLIYGESKVALTLCFSMLLRKLVDSVVGCRRGHGSRRIQQDAGDLFSPTVRSLWSR